MLFLSGEDVKGLVSMEEAIEAVEEAFRRHAGAGTVYPPKDQFTLPTEEWRWWAFMPAYVEGMGVACKIVSEYPENRGKERPLINATIVLGDEKTGEVKAVMDGTRLTAVRTGALGAVAARHLARKDAKTAGIIGCGVQARAQLEGLSKVRGIERVKIYDPNDPAMDAFIEDMQGLGPRIEQSDPKGVLDADIVVAATVSKEPVVLGEHVKPGTHVTSIGAHVPDARELDDALMKKAKIVIDSPDAMKSGDLKDYRGEVTEIKDVVAGRKVRAGGKDVTVFKSVGTALQDVAVASLAWRKAKGKGAGKNLGF